jgi:hypothetical protein
MYIKAGNRKMFREKSIVWGLDFLEEQEYKMYRVDNAKLVDLFLSS